ncbi:integration host factor subunit beta [Sphingomonas sp. UV9]|jgi:integration host factor subunit beta|uniref:HU family DNA-binding protein n=1 Tax=Sphingomonas TaxID=13687 RepID=UPI000FFC27EE|nr:MULTISPECIES: HU family DNA-binding protein [Sphingomonas]RXD01517.1 integration host factor subunit beta [Sphingomonas sp. UV9]
MRKSDLIQRIALLNPDLPSPVCRTLVEKLFDAIVDHLRDGGAVELRGFGRFFLSQHAQRTVRNPRTGETFLRDEFAAVRFRAGKAICAQINAEVPSK